MSLLQDDTYNGYFIPKGTIVIPNIFAMNHDPEIFPDPGVFRPERWIGQTMEKEASVPIPPNVGNVWFGFGRR